MQYESSVTENYLSLKPKVLLGVLSHTCNPSTKETEAKGLSRPAWTMQLVQAQPELQNETKTQKQKRLKPKALHTSTKIYLYGGGFNYVLNDSQFNKT